MTILLSRYKIIKQIGTGGFGDTHLAEDTALPGNPKCVVKHLKRNPDPGVLAISQRLFENEAKILQDLGKHDQIPALYAYFEDKGEFFLVQEFVDGHDLNQEIVLGKKLSEEKAIKLIQEILEVLSFVHQQNIIHRDIKPSNIMRRHDDGKIVLIDFGAVKEIAAFIVNSQGQTSLTVGIGTPGYMPSEQANGRPKFASDVYAVGIIGIQAVTGLLPAQLEEDSTTGEIIWRNYAQVSDRFAEVLNNMVRDHFSQRYKNTSEALQALNKIENKKDFPAKILVGFGVAVAVSFAGGYAMNNVLSNQGDPKVAATSQPSVKPQTSSKETSTPQTPVKPKSSPKGTSTPQPPVKPKSSPKATSTPQPSVKITTNKAKFRNLDKLLAAKKWKEADIETYKIILKIARREKEGNLDFNSIKNFSCSSLQDIDKRWVKASNGRFGFSVQKQIWNDIAGTVGYNSDDFNKFADRVGWRRENNWLRYSELTYNINAPRGHLPNTPPEYIGIGFRRMIPLISPCKL
ncbi:GUN4 domain-containing protein [Sphaerospermopsis kisseleviana CS-549]|uniref:non-specific serine/threonine protein kinase n=2 Tax=Sphaerospermopsis TaxID=752201 RepID=A0ABR9VGN1_9CYAN|nr:MULTISPECIES: serine/threonine-protein kinase [Sphaerospermopsis]MBE9237646.1 GUN4 domain-containing protein [Sphaerospermopsis aphanizomenoides LEGE 00250]MDB9442845.1 GUN4 domain-containing protein [Sphaerospermopsis kisseleviana CS-549]BAZ79725.1 serine/threonine protein kinase [Sphaerospermopsis kisseleviana NIES-73]